uniref:Ig-like domain-containing protein n=1 Tax=Gopherus evgoodei TaxID=1825980 RepID=A0A8C4Y8J6_9SAUR
MGRALPPQQDPEEWELPPQGPPWILGGPATLRVLILALLWRGSSSQLPGFTLTVPRSVSVQEGLCILVPCTFTYPASYDTDNSWARLYRYWYKDPANVGWDPPVASSNPSRGVSQETLGRFQLAENPADGDCSLQISDARRTDAGRYFLRVEKGSLRYSYHFNSYGTDAKLISPAHGLPGTLLAGEPVTVTCTAPGRCSGPPPRVTWTGPFSDTARDVSAHFTPGPGDHGEELVCTVTYRPPQGPSTRRTVRLHVGCETPNITGTLTRNGHPAEDDVVSLETWEGDSLSLGCEAGNRPEAALSWAKGNESLSPSQGRISAGLIYGTPCPGFLSLTINLSLCLLLSPDSPRPGTGLNSSCQRQGLSVSCSCSLRSHPPPQLHWQVDGEPLAGNSSRGALQVSSWAQGDEAVSTLNWMGSGDGGPRIFCLGSNRHGTYRGETLGLLGSVPGSGREPGLLGSLPSPGRRVGSGCWKQGSWEPGLLDTIHRPGRAVESSGKSTGLEARTPGRSPWPNQSPAL